MYAIDPDKDQTYQFLELKTSPNIKKAEFGRNFAVFEGDGNRGIFQ